MQGFGKLIYNWKVRLKCLISFLPETQPQLMLTGPMAMGGAPPGAAAAAGAAGYPNSNSFGAGSGMATPGSNYQGYSM